MTDRFWEEKSLHQLDQTEWEALCDGCARCCMIKLQDEDTEEVHYTAVVCRLMDQQTARCTRYPERHALVEDCVVLDAERSLEFHWLPKSCAYRTLAEGRKLAWWHPLVSGDPQTVAEAGISVLDKVVSETDVHEDEVPEMIVQWVEQ